MTETVVWTELNYTQSSLTEIATQEEHAMIEVELEIVGKPPGGRPFEGYKTAQFRNLPRIREYIVFGSNYYEVEKIFHWEGEQLPRVLLRYAGYM